MIPDNKGDTVKSWKKINKERKLLRKQRKQEKLLKSLEREEMLKSNSKVEMDEESVTINTTTKTHEDYPSTISIAVPGSILENAQSLELRTYVAGQIARAACIFRANEIIVFDDLGLNANDRMKIKYMRNFNQDDNGTQQATNDGQSTTNVRYSCLQMARILQYLECPQYLRKFFFPLHKDLKYSGLLNPLDAPHHLRQQNIFSYREGIVTEKPAKTGQCYVNVGLLNDVLVDKSVKPGLRVTVKLHQPEVGIKKQRGCIVSPDEPRRKTGIYWGYTVRIAHSLSEIFTKCPYANGYDVTVGTSDRGKNVHDIPTNSISYNHMLIVFGGLHGIEVALNNDDKLHVDEPELLFDHYVNVLPRQGSRTIRTEEALLIALTALQEKISAQVPDMTPSDCMKSNLAQSLDTGIVNRTSKPKLIDNNKSKIKHPLKRKINNDCNDEVEKAMKSACKLNVNDASEQQQQQQRVDNELHVNQKKPIKNPFKTPPVSNEPVVVDFEIVPPTNVGIIPSAKRKRHHTHQDINKPHNYCNNNNYNNQINEDLSRFD